ncbi:hypothetical protein MesoLj131a_01380 [Mesorhizobium sp. 131-2-1]|jgi:hypothetical protein|nr:hypothetical protein MesoLj131a_01380 [Mesorhizobium sp. 131-2-1]
MVVTVYSWFGGASAKRHRQRAMEMGNAKISSVRDARTGIPHRTDEPLGQVCDPGIRPRGSENSSHQAHSGQSG